MPNTLHIQGTDYSNDIASGLDDITIVSSLNTGNKTVGKTLSSNIKAEGQLYEFLKNKFYSDCNNWIESCKSLFRSSICNGLPLDTEITSEGMTICKKQKYIDFRIQSTDQIGRCYEQLNSQYITDQGFCEKYKIPIVWFCDQPGWIQWALLLFLALFRFALNVIDTIINAILSVIRALCDAVNFLNPFGNPLNCDGLSVNFSGIFSRIDQWISGCGRWGASPLIRDMITHQAEHCGLKFVSSILNDPASSRYNLSLFCMDRGEHGDCNEINDVRKKEILDANKPLYTTVGLLEDLKPLFAADYRIIGNTLYFENEDFFTNLASVELLNTKDHCTDDDICISYRTTDAYAKAEYEYTDDAYDTEGNSTGRHHYIGLYTWNPPEDYNPAQKGCFKQPFNFGMARFMWDKVSYESDGFFNFKRLIDEFRDGPSNFFNGLFFGNEGKLRERDLIMKGSTISHCKLLVLEDGFNYDDAHVVRSLIGTKGGKKYYSYNEPMHVDNLYNDFLYKQNPRLNRARYDITGFTIECDCDIVEQVLNNFQRLHIKVPHCGSPTGFIKGIAGSIEKQITDKKSRITFSEIIGYCD